ncbi:hypothetical protein SEA_WAMBURGRXPRESS_117 [Mycobacterium phage Wamburgrxpress]|uniref:Uncharacterized protein n=1 Tax=Mycobacterium phage Wamburgrxpress TaxID=2315617 RepID=A0A386KC08_9CAUD|nr:hypothetical protein SEA_WAMBURGRXPRESS_117 [Mycobacterium phage Wamburgrxpress]
MTCQIPCSSLVRPCACDEHKRDQSAGRAEAIRSRLSRIDDQLRGALRLAREAHELSEQDYEHNDERLGRIVALLEVVSAENIHECHRWRDYAHARGHC